MILRFGVRFLGANGMAGFLAGEAPASVRLTNILAATPPLSYPFLSMKTSDPDEMNEQRAAWAAEALDRFRHLTGSDPGEEALRDVLTDLHHWADQADLNWDAALTSAMNHYRAETAEAPLDELS